MFLDPQECANGFALQEILPTVQSVLNGGRHTLNMLQSVSPEIKFTCDGSITKWIVGAFWNNDISHTHYPDLQVWRKVSDSNSESEEYYKVGNTTITVTSESNYSHVYEYIVDPPLPVEAGDVLGIFQAELSDSQLSLYYESDTGPSILYQTSSTSLN